MNENYSWICLYFSEFTNYQWENGKTTEWLYEPTRQYVEPTSTSFKSILPTIFSFATSKKFRGEFHCQWDMAPGANS